MAATHRVSVGAAGECSWPLLLFLPVFALTFLTQRAFLACACRAGSAYLAVGMVLDGLILARIVLAYLRCERNRAWYIYLFALPTSVFWVPIYVELVWGAWGFLSGR